jgi:hypothetical protein
LQKNFWLHASRSWEWWYTYAIPALRRLRQEDLKFKASLGYTARPHLKRKKERKKN